MNKIIYFLAVVLFIAGCGGSNQQLPVNNSAFSSSENNLIVPITPQQTQTRKIHIRNFTGPYPETIKDKNLGEGLLDNYYARIKQLITQNLIRNKTVNLKFEIVGQKNSDTEKILKGIKNYFANAKGFNIFLLKYQKPDVLVQIKTDKTTGVVLFYINYPNNVIFNKTTQDFVKTDMPLSAIVKEAKSFWSVVKIPTNMMNAGVRKYAVYKIMKRPVLVSEFRKIYTTTPQAVTNVSFDEADDYCFKKYKGSIASLYVFEYAMRKGLLIPATKYGVSEEMVAAFDYANPEDMILKMPGDVVSLTPNKCSSITDRYKRALCFAKNTDNSKILLFNYNTQSYVSGIDGYSSDNVTFRCMIKGSE